MQAKDIMTHSVVSVDPDDTVQRAIQLMLKNNISGLPVIDLDGHLQGMVTEGDLLRRSEIATQRQRSRWLQFFLGPGRLADEYVHSHARKVAEIMTPEPVTVAEETPLEAVVSLMEKRRIKRVAVIRGNRVVGMLSRANLLRALAAIVPEAGDFKTDDRSVRDAIMSELKKQPWTQNGWIDVLVRNGVVDLWGCILDERERKALIVAAENTPGVRRVNDHVALVEPVSGFALVPEGIAEKQDAG